MRTTLAENTVGVLAMAGPAGAWAMPVRYRVDDLELDCLVPRWADLPDDVEPQPAALMVVLLAASSAATPLCWLQYRGHARVATVASWSGALPAGVPEALAGDLYSVLHIVPDRIDVLDERRGWGARETVEIGGERR